MKLFPFTNSIIYSAVCLLFHCVQRRLRFKCVRRIQMHYLRCDRISFWGWGDGVVTLLKPAVPRRSVGDRSRLNNSNSLFVVHVPRNVQLPIENRLSDESERRRERTRRSDFVGPSCADCTHTWLDAAEMRTCSAVLCTFAPCTNVCFRFSG